MCFTSPSPLFGSTSHMATTADTSSTSTRSPEKYDARLHDDGVFLVRGHNPGPFTLQGTNCYLLSSGEPGNAAVLLDTGEGNQPDFMADLAGAMSLCGATSLSAIIISHFHHDHVGGVFDVLAAYPGTPVMKHAHAEADAAAFLPDGVEFAPLKDGMRVPAGAGELEVIHTPGHTSDSCSFLLHPSRVCFTGDCILGGSSSSVFRELNPYLASLRRLEAVAPSALFCGHGASISGTDAALRKIQGYIKHRLDREQQVLAALREGGTAPTATSIATAMYGGEGVVGSLMGAATKQVLVHLVKLLEDGVVCVAEAPSEPELPTVDTVWRLLPHETTGFGKL